MIVAGVLAWQLSRQWQEPEPSLGANVASAATAELLSLRQTGRRGRARDRQGEREMKRGRRHLPPLNSPPVIHQHASFLQPNNHHGPVTLPTVCQRLSTLATEGPQQMDGRDWLAEWFYSHLTSWESESLTPGYYAFAPRCHGSLNFFLSQWVGGDRKVEVGCTGREWA